jgi:hypothetical protein
MRPIIRGAFLGGVLAVVVGLATAVAEPLQPPTARLRFFACATVRFFGAGCPPDADTAPASSTPPASASVVAPSASAQTPMASEHPASDAAPGDTTMPPEPLFPPETVSSDTPPLLLRLLQDPTVANARAFLAWYQARLARIQQVQALLRALGTPAEAPAAREITAQDAPGPELPSSPPLFTPPAAPRQPVTPAE